VPIHAQTMPNVCITNQVQHITRWCCPTCVALYILEVFQVVWYRNELYFLLSKHVCKPNVRIKTKEKIGGLSLQLLYTNTFPFDCMPVVVCIFSSFICSLTFIILNWSLLTSASDQRLPSQVIKTF